MPILAGTAADSAPLAALSLRKGYGPAPRGIRPVGFSRDEETFARTVALAVGPFLHVQQTGKVEGTRLKAEADHLESMQQVQCFT